MRCKLCTDPGIMALVDRGKDFRFYNTEIGISGEFKREK